MAGIRETQLAADEVFRCTAFTRKMPKVITLALLVSPYAKALYGGKEPTRPGMPYDAGANIDDFTTKHRILLCLEGRLKSIYRDYHHLKKHEMQVLAVIEPILLRSVAGGHGASADDSGYRRIFDDIRRSLGH